MHLFLHGIKKISFLNKLLIIYCILNLNKLVTIYCILNLSNRLNIKGKPINKSNEIDRSERSFSSDKCLTYVLIHGFFILK